MSEPTFIHKVALRLAHDVTWPQRRRWSYTFNILAPNPAAAAAAVVGGWVSNLRFCHKQTVFAYEAYAHDNVTGTDRFSTVPVPIGQQRGTVGIVSQGEPYLLKTVASVPLLVPNSRPSRKFIRPGFYELEIVNGVTIRPDVSANIQDNVEDFVQSLAGRLVDPDGQFIDSTGLPRLTTREFGRTAGNNVPEPPPVG